MKEKIKVLVVEGQTSGGQSITKLLEFNPNITSVGRVVTAKEAIERTRLLHPDIVLMDANLPDMDGITATELISAEAPSVSVIMMSDQMEKDYLRRAMLAGAKNFLTKPFTGGELFQAVNEVFEYEQKRRNTGKFGRKSASKSKVISVFSTKGGVGKTTIASNLAMALAIRTDTRVAIVDADFQFGDVTLFLNATPRTTIVDLVRDIDQLDDAMLESYMTDCKENLKVLAAPLRPEEADLITGSHLTAILRVMKQSYDYVIIDTAPSFQDTVLAALDASDQVLVISVTDLPTIKNVKIGLEVMETLGYTEEKIKPVLNKAEVKSQLDLREVQDSLKYIFTGSVPNDDKIVIASVNKGIPFVISNPDSSVTQGIFRIAKGIAGIDWKADEPPAPIKPAIKKPAIPYDEMMI